MIKKIPCRHFIGEKPCGFHKKCKGIDCRDFKPFGKRIVVIKLAAIGDVLRTTSILPALRKKHGDVHITWVSAAQSKEMLGSNPCIDRIMAFNLESVLCLLVEKFDLLISLDKAPAATSLASLIDAKRKMGFGMGKAGRLTYFNKASRYAYTLGFDDELKFRKNRKTYQEIIFDMCELKGPYGEYIAAYDKKEKRRANSLFRKWNLKKRDRVVGLNTGAGRVFLTKKWSENSFAKLAGLLHKKLGVRILLLGGPDEVETNKYIKRRTGAPVINTGNNHTIKQFAELIGLCDLVVASDTLAMHLAIAKKVPVVALFGSTTPHEVDLYGRGVKMFAGVECAPCYKSVCKDMKCMKALTPEMIFEECAKLIK